MLTSGVCSELRCCIRPHNVQELIVALSRRTVFLLFSLAKRELLGSKKAKTYNSGYSLVVTHLTTNPPVHCLNRAERTGSLVLNVLWSYVKDMVAGLLYKALK